MTAFERGIIREVADLDIGTQEALKKCQKYSDETGERDNILYERYLHLRHCAWFLRWQGVDAVGSGVKRMRK